MIKDLFHKNRPVYSLEVFPPKKDTDVSVIYDALDQFKELHPNFISVTYGAGGTTSENTFAIASYIQNQCGIEALTHLTCAAIPDRLFLTNFLTNLYRNGIRNILGLRGDQPKGMSDEQFAARYYDHASDLIQDIKTTFPFSVAGACYPEIHQEASSLEEDIANLKIKVDTGVDFLITQLFYDNDTFFRFVDLARKAGITVPILPGLMPITSAGQVKNIIELSGTKVPDSLMSQIETYKDSPEDLKKAGLEFTKKQMEQLLEHGVDGIHLYSMNKVEIAKFILE
ncbi:MAG: methylenetetrahydrofolate reductase [NAD(P)H] [Eubacterium sp.]|nr:methylenetetrahydrofolate reductase [NAD(P)H] [Eubacterium sp.]MCI9412456.1 methylenetetrahydrofolate reductase [NAD(P)H] [Eubacterium sp.]